MATNNSLDFGELQNDLDFVQKATNLDQALQDIETHMKSMEKVNYEKLSLEDKVKYDLFRAYSINSLFWIYLKLEGVDPAQHGIAHELSRVKEAMKKEKLLQDRKTMTRVNQAAAKRIVKHELWTPKAKTQGMLPKGGLPPVNKKRKFED